MADGVATLLRPVFIASPAGRLFAVHYRSAVRRPSHPAVLFVPPFAEEMNRSRRMAALQARAFAAAGVDCLLLDLFGTGDSAGDFRDARLASWGDDIVAAADWLETQGSAVACLWGLRLGALLAAAAAAARPERFRRLLLWQPVIDGKAMLTQFLRIRVAASMAEGGTGEKTEELRAQLAAGTAVEVAGYEIAPELGRALDEMRLDRLMLPAGLSVTWLEVAAEPSAQILPAGARLIENWRQKGIAVAAASVAGDPFWSLQETTIAPALLEATTRSLQSCPA